MRRLRAAQGLTLAELAGSADISPAMPSRHGPETFLLKPGDTLTFRGDVPHGPVKLLKTPIRMLSVIVYSGSDPDSPT